MSLKSMFMRFCTAFIWNSQKRKEFRKKYTDAQIPSNCVVATMSIVNKKIDKENIILAGIPAKIVKRT